MCAHADECHICPAKLHLIQQETLLNDHNQQKDEEVHPILESNIDGSCNSEKDMPQAEQLRSRRCKTSTQKISLDPVQEGFEQNSKDTQSQSTIIGENENISMDAKYLIQEETGMNHEDGFFTTARGSQHRTASIASSGYYSDRSSQRLSEMSLSLSDSWNNETHLLQHESWRASEQSSSIKDFTRAKEIHPKQTHKVEQSVTEKRPSLERNRIESSVEEFRPRTKSLPENARSIRNLVSHKLHKQSTTFSSTSLKTENSELTESYSSSQYSLFSGDQSSSDSSGGKLN